jgi:hypothetical protein
MFDKITIMLDEDKRFEIYEECKCEHCGVLEPYDIIYLSEEYGNRWCLSCASMEINIGDYSKQLLEVSEKSKEMKIKYYENKLKELKG